MFFKIALRNLLKRKVYAAINIIGLSIGLAAALTIFLFVQDELSYDKFYPDADRIVRIARSSTQGEEVSYSAATNYKLGELAAEKLSAIELLTQFSVAMERQVKLGDKTFVEKKVHWADDNFLDVFGLEVLSGNAEEALAKPNQLVITKSISDKLFQNQEALGQMVNIDGDEYTISAVVNDLPTNTHFHFDYLLSLETSRGIYSAQMFEHWGNVWLYTYAKLKDNVAVASFDDQLNKMVFEHGPQEAVKQFGVKFFSQPVKDIHLHSNYPYELETNGDFQLLSVLGAVAILIVLIACFNFINLSTARSMWRAKEVGVKKVLGIQKRELIRQFLGESLLITFISLLFSIVLITSFLPFFNAFTQKQIGISNMLMSTPILLAIVIIVGLIAGAFPAFILSSFEPKEILKGKSSQGDTKFAGGMRKVLVAVQFAISILLIAGATVIYEQLNYIKTKDLGVDISDVIVLELKNRDIRSKSETIKNGIAELSAVESVSVASDVPFENLNSWRIKPVGAGLEHQLINIISVDDDYINTMGLKVKEGQIGRLEQGSIIVNQAFVDYFLMANPVGSQLEIDHKESPVTVAAVIEDFHYESLHTKIRPVVLYNEANWNHEIVVKLNDGADADAIADISKVWERQANGQAFEYYFVTDKFQSMYQAEEKTADMVTFFSIFSIIIACLGLYGLAAFIAEAKLKEISIRKVLGASLKQLLQLQFSVFFSLIIFGAIIGLPLSYFLMDKWLDNFVYRIDVPIWVMPMAVIILLLFSLISVSSSALKAAVTNPSETLRND